MNKFDINIYNKIKLIFQLGKEANNLIFIKELPINKTLKKVIDELERENPHLKKFSDNVGNIVSCQRENIDCQKQQKKLIMNLEISWEMIPLLLFLK